MVPESSRKPKEVLKGFGKFQKAPESYSAIILIYDFLKFRVEGGIKKINGIKPFFIILEQTLVEL